MIGRQFEFQPLRPRLAAGFAIALVCLLQIGIAIHDAQHGPGEFTHVCEVCLQLDAPPVLPDIAAVSRPLETASTLSIEPVSSPRASCLDHAHSSRAPPSA